VEGGHDFHQPLRFPGHYFDAETGLHCNRFRYYSPELGRYLESDPDGILGGLNLYAYTANPLREVDVRGLGCGGTTDSADARTEPEAGPDPETAARPAPRYQPGNAKLNAAPRLIQGDLEMRLRIYEERHNAAARRADPAAHDGLHGLSRAQLELARSPGDTEAQRNARQQVLRAFIGTTRYDAGESNGHDYSHPVFIGPPPPQPTTQGQWQAHGGVGGYFGDSDLGGTPHDYGVHDEGWNRDTRTVQRKQLNVLEMVNGNEPYIQSRNAACIDRWSNKPNEYWTYGGGVQRTYSDTSEAANQGRARRRTTLALEHND
jgi:RHS repeat-associated protein